jgi:hypothetical protein
VVLVEAGEDVALDALQVQLGGRLRGRPPAGAGLLARAGPARGRVRRVRRAAAEPAAATPAERGRRAGVTAGGDECRGPGPHAARLQHGAARCPGWLGRLGGIGCRHRTTRSYMFSHRDRPAFPHAFSALTGPALSCRQDNHESDVRHGSCGSAVPGVIMRRVNPLRNPAILRIAPTPNGSPAHLHPLGVRNGYFVFLPRQELTSGPSASGRPAYPVGQVFAGQHIAIGDWRRAQRA